MLGAMVAGAVAVGAWSSGADAGSSTPRLAGNFRAELTYESTNNTVGGGALGTTAGEYWTFDAACGTGACTTTLRRLVYGIDSFTNVGPGDAYVYKLEPVAAGEYEGTTTNSFLANCYSNPQTEIAHDVFVVTEQLTLFVDSSSGGAVTSFHGTIVENFTPVHNQDICDQPGTRTFTLTAHSSTATGANCPGGQFYLCGSPVPVVPRPQGVSTIASWLVTPNHAFPLNGATVLDAVLTLATMLLITFPAQLFNKTLDENYDEIRSIVRTRAPWLSTVRSKMRLANLPVSRANLLRFVGVVVLGAVIGGFNDPTFGFSVISFETLVAVVLAFVVAITVAAAAAHRYRKARHLDPTYNLRAIPAGLLVAVICVIVSRISHFEPGYLYGVVAGVVFSAQLSTREEGHDAALATLSTLVLAIVAWIAFVPVSDSTYGISPAVWDRMAATFLAALFVSGVVNTVINLVPLRFLAGHTLIRWHKGVWSAMFAVSVFLLLEVMLLPAARQDRLGDAPFAVAVFLFALFGGVSFAFNRYFVAYHRRQGAAGEQREAQADVTEQETTLGTVAPKAGPDFIPPVR